MKLRKKMILYISNEFEELKKDYENNNKNYFKIDIIMIIIQDKNY